MKRIILFFTVCLGLSVSGTTFADNAESARAANKRSNITTVSTNKRVENTQNKNTRTVSKNAQPQQRAATRTPATINSNTKSRTNAQQSQQKNVIQRTNATRQAVSNRTVNARKPIVDTKTSRSATNTGRKQTARASELNKLCIMNAWMNSAPTKTLICVDAHVHQEFMNLTT